MCGRFAFDAELGQLETRFQTIAGFDRVTPHYNIAPGMCVPIIIRNSSDKAILARWGLIPSWAKDPKIAYRTINARSEGIAEKPVFRGPFRSHRCLVPTTGFFEWRHIKKEKVPYYIHLKNDTLFAFAGLYDIWNDAEGYPLTTFTIITTTPNRLMEPIHNRMPVIFSQKDEDVWLNPDEHDTAKLLKLLDPYPEKDMMAVPVSKRVNNPGNDTKDILIPQSEQTILM